jgi:hypothetical protein
MHIIDCRHSEADQWLPRDKTKPTFGIEGNSSIGPWKRPIEKPPGVPTALSLSAPRWRLPASRAGFTVWGGSLLLRGLRGAFVLGWSKNDLAVDRQGLPRDVEAVAGA